MRKRTCIFLITFLLIFSSMSVVNGYSDPSTVFTNDKVSSSQSKEKAKDRFQRDPLQIGVKGSYESTKIQSDLKTAKKTNTIVLKFANPDHISKVRISEKVVGKFKNINTVTIEIPIGADASKILEKYKKNPYIENAYVDIEVSHFFIATDPYYPTYQWNLQRIGMESAWNFSQGEPTITVAVIDTGFGPFSDIDERVNGAYISSLGILEDTYPGQYSYDGDFHGTAVTSLIASNINTTGIAGVAPNVKTMAVKVFDDHAETTSSIQLSAGVRWAADHGADIINMSLGANESSPDILEAVEYALAKGITLVAASGNDGYSNFISYPAAYPGVIAVGSTNNTDGISTFSNKGSQLDLVAPGERIYLANVTGGTASFASMSGTSFSSPTVAAVASLVKGLHPEFSSRQIQQVLFTGTEDMLVEGWDSSSGYGILNAAKALNVANQQSLFDGNDSISEASRIYANTEVTGHTYPVLDYDVYKFVLYQSSYVNVTVTSQGSQDMVIDLYDTTLGLIENVDNTSNGIEQSATHFLPAGTYYVNTYDYFGDVNDTAYQLKISASDTLAPQITIKAGDEVLASGSVTYHDVYVTAEDTSNVVLSATKDTENYSWPTLGVFAENGDYVVSAIDAMGNTSFETFSIQKTGEFVLSFDTQGGTLIDARSVSVYSTFDAPEPPIRTGYTFGGWYKEAACVNAWDFETMPIVSDLTLYAKWTINKYTFKFDSQGGTAISSKVADFMTKVAIPNPPTRSGYLFTGWYKDLNYTTLWDFANDPVSENTTVYAKWLATPTAILGLKAESAGYNSVKLSWTQVTGVTYEIYRAVSATGTYTKLADVVASTYTSTNLSTNVTYYFKVRPYKTEGAYRTNGATSTYVSARPIPSTVKATVSSSSYNSLRTTWPAIAGASGYQVYRSLYSNGTYYLMTTTTSTSYLNASLTTNRLYYYKVRAYRWVGTTKVYGAFSTIVSARPVPSAPVITSTHLSYNSVKVSWPSVLGANGYEVSKAFGTSTTFTVHTTTTGLTTTLTGLTPNVKVSLRVRSYRMVGTLKVFGPYSNLSTSTPYPLAPVLNAGVTPTSVLLSWKSEPGITRYTIYHDETGLGNFEKIGESSSTSFNHDGLVLGSTHAYKVIGSMIVGTSELFTPASAIISRIVAAPAVTGLLASSTAYDRISLKWNASSGAAGYEISVATSSTGVYSVLTETDQISYLKTGLAFNVYHYFKVRPYSFDGETKVYGAYSSIVSAKTAVGIPVLIWKNVSSTAINLSWSTILGASGYEIYRSSTSTGTYTLQTTTTSVSYTKSALSKGTVYYYKIRSYRWVGNSKVYGAFSAPKYVKVGY